MFRFESENKEYFEKLVPPRSNDYYEYDKFFIILESLLEEQDEEKSFFYLVKNDWDAIIGRINIVDIDWESGHGNLGYRIGRTHTGKGIASKALNMLLNQENKITQLSAKTTQDNIGSQKVLEKNKFEIVELRKEADYNFIYYRWFKR
ncbi:GNAT family N-acetyltransferase [Ornithinibacillus salinisoli]|uniref:GNAT family N-acetyltransferase n=1 Tax=Ornithinibacillus salinisoli TaxID=1848459 RepID=A0ABW4W5I3_9BACI